MKDTEARSEALIRAPAGCAFLHLIEQMGIPPLVAADPTMSLYFAANAVTDVSVWRQDHMEHRAWLLAEGPRLLPLARAIASHPATAWWWGPLDRENQLWLNDGSPYDWQNVEELPVERVAPQPSVVPNRAPSKNELYAQKPDWGLRTYTVVDRASSILMNGGDMNLVRPPYVCYRLSVSEAARVYEVDGPESWHQLCLRYPAVGQHPVLPTYPSPNPAYLVPDFAAAARDWDGVHLTLGGLLTSEQVSLSDSAGTTEHWGWDGEQTIWLRWCFETQTRMPDIAFQPKFDELLYLPWSARVGGDEAWRGLGEDWNRAGPP